jgi:hypothetical protein
MKLASLSILTTLLFSAMLLFSRCDQNKPVSQVKKDKTPAITFNGYESKEKWGEHLVIVGACHDCHTPKKMTAMGPVLDSSSLLSGHIAGSPEPEVNKKEIQSKGLAVTSDLTTWIGPWGTSYTANLTSDATGIGNWKEEQFMLALREGKYKGLAGSRTLLPPMPWEMYRHFTDDEIKAIFAYLKSTKAVKNIVPPPVPPVAK